MRLSGRCKLLVPGALLALLGACQVPPHVAAPPGAAAPAPAAAAAPQAGAPYEVVPDASLLTILVYRAGALASVGHNHVIASHELSGTLYVASDELQSSFELHIPVATLTVDEAGLRASESAADFPPDVSEGARAGTRRNMLGAALLDGAHSPEIVLRAVRLEPAAAPAPGGTAGTHAVLAQVESTIRGQQRTFSVPVCYRLADGMLSAAGDFPLRQSDLGLTPFSAMLGALQVQDEMRIRFRLVARRAPLAGALSASPAPPAARPPDTPCAAPRA